MKKNVLGQLRRGEIIGGIIYWPCYLLVTQVVLALVLHLLGINIAAQPGFLLLNLLFLAVNFVVVAIIFHRFLWQQAKVACRQFGRTLLYVMAGLGLYFASNLLLGAALNVVTTALDLEITNINNEAVQQMARQSYLPMLLMTVICAPVTEECLCRGLLFCGLYGRSRFWAYLLSMLAFAGIHVYGTAFGQPLVQTLLCLVQYLPAGLWLAWVYRKSQSIWASILLHGAINLAAMLMVKLAV